jgi:uncharacterized membrane protein (UPF0136 family)
MGWLDICLIVYSLIMLFGGFMGYRTAGSMASLWTGLISAALLIAATAWARTNPKQGYTLASLVVLVLIGIFFERYMKTQKVMPGLMLAVGSVVMLVLLIIGHFMSKKKM